MNIPKAIQYAGQRIAELEVTIMMQTAADEAKDEKIAVLEKNQRPVRKKKDKPAKKIG